MNTSSFPQKGSKMQDTVITRLLRNKHLSTEKGRYFYWINERHAIYQRRIKKEQAPWTTDPILQNFKFTNPFRENDRVTVWMRNNWTKPNDNKSWAEIVFNCCLFRMIGTVEFAEEHGWVEFDSTWNPLHSKQLISDMISQKKRTFTGAYIITNQGLKLPKAEVVIDHFLKPIYKDSDKIAEVAKSTRSLQETHEFFKQYRGWGGGGFMSYEVVTDLNYTPVLRYAEDRFEWANAGPGAIRGLNRIHQRELKKGMSQIQANHEMQLLLEDAKEFILPHVPLAEVDMRTIEHSLCEWDKYERVLHGQGKPRSKYDGNTLLQVDLPEGGVA